MLNTAIVGLGWWGRQIVNSLEDSDRIRIATAVDPNLAAAQDFADTKDLALIGSYDEMLDDPAIDAVILATPHGLHESQVLAAATAGKQIFCEKPLALEGAAATRMLAACKAAGIVLGIGHERRYEGALEEMLRMVTAAELGTLLHIEINWSHNIFAGNPQSGWRQDPKQAPAGTMTATGIHMTDYIQTLAGPVAHLNAQKADRSPHYPGADIISVQFAFENGVSGSLCNIATTPFYQRISVFGDRGWAEIRETTNVDDPAPAHFTWRGMDMQIHERIFEHTDTVRINLEAWADAVAGSAPYRFTDAHKLHNVQILEAITRSMETNERQKIG